MTFLDELDIKEKNAIENLRMRLKNAMNSEMLEDNCLFYRFLKARNFDVDKAETMLRKHLKWRKIYQVDTILEDFKPKEYFHKYCDINYLGTAKDGNYVFYSPMGKIDVRDILRCEKVNTHMKNMIWLSERMLLIGNKIKEETGKELVKGIIIADMDKLTLRNTTSKHCADLCLRYTHLLSDNYPEYLKAFYIINAPRYIEIVYSLVKTVMSHELAQKFHVYGYNGWKNKLLECIDADVLPGFLGGNRTDPDGNPLCTTFVRHGGKFSEIYYLPDSERWFKDLSRVKRLLVSPRSKKEIEVDIAECGSLIRWEFVCNKDIGFGLLMKTSNEEEMSDLLPMEKYETRDGTEEGWYRTQSTGKYVIIFDNSYSWMISKEIKYCITVVEAAS